MTNEEILELYDDRSKLITIIEDGDWVAEHKYQYRDVIIQFEDKYYSINESRSGSPFSDYEYDEPTICEVTPVEKTIVVKTWVPV